MVLICRYSNVKWLDQDVEPSGRQPGDRRLVFTLEKSGVGTLLAKYVTGDYRQDLHHKLAALDLTPKIHEVRSTLWHCFARLNGHSATPCPTYLHFAVMQETLHFTVIAIGVCMWAIELRLCLPGLHSLLKAELTWSFQDLSKAHKHSPW